MSDALNLLGSGSLFGNSVSGLDSLGSPDDWLVDAAPQGDPSTLAGALPSTRNEPHTVEAPPAAAIGGGGQLSQALDNAMGWVGTMYDWGGNGYDGRGVDCSGLVYNAFKRAGFNIQRYRAVDYGHMGAAVDESQARAGDIVYFDNPGSDTDHVGIYIGNGKFIESPQPGQRVQVSNLRSGAQIRRIFGGSAPDLQTSPTGNTQYYGPDGTVYTSNHKVPNTLGAQRDPLEVLSAVDESANAVLNQDPTLNLGTPTVDSPTNEGTPTSPTGSPLDKVMNALGQQESGGDYSVVNGIGARGKYQVMTANVGNWSEQVLGYRISPAEFSARPDLQEKIVRGIFGNYLTKYGLRGALAAWYSGDPKRESDYSSVRGGPSVGAYVDQVIGRIGG